MTNIKICGLSDTHLLEQVCTLDIHFVGFVHHPTSVRHVDIGPLAELVNATPEPIKSVVVVVDPSDQTLADLFDACSPDYIQLHGSESPDRVAAIKATYRTNIIKAIAVASEADIAGAEAYVNVADMILFDTKSPTGTSGGSGKPFDWSLLSAYPSSKPWMLSGGLSADNVQQAIATTHAPAVDASSHLETPVSSGRKDIEKIRAFVSSI